MDERASDYPGSSDNLPFDSAGDEPDDSSSPGCEVCRQPIGDGYYELNGVMICDTCRYDIELKMTGGSRFQRFILASVAGSVAAGVGAAIYFVISLFTGYEFALVGLLVGLLVGGAVRYGSGGRGGWFYQFLAMYLTYSAIVVTYIPYIIEGFNQMLDEDAQVTATAPAQEEETDEAAAAPALASADEQSESAAEGAEDPLDLDNLSGGEIVAAVILVALVTLVFAYLSPIIVAFSGGGIIGLIIIAVALYEAWILNKRPRMELTGPHFMDAHAAQAPPPFGNY